MCQSFFHDGWATPLDPFFLAAPSSAAGWQPRRSCVSAFPCGSCRWAFPPTCSLICSLPLRCMSAHPDYQVRQHTGVPKRLLMACGIHILPAQRTIKWLRQGMKQQPVASVAHPARVSGLSSNSVNNTWMQELSVSMWAMAKLAFHPGPLAEGHWAAHRGADTGVPRPRPAPIPCGPWLSSRYGDSLLARVFPMYQSLGVLVLVLQSCKVSSPVQHHLLDVGWPSHGLPRGREPAGKHMRLAR